MEEDFTAVLQDDFSVFGRQVTCVKVLQYHLDDPMQSLVSFEVQCDGPLHFDPDAHNALLEKLDQNQLWLTVKELVGGNPFVPLLTWKQKYGTLQVSAERNMTDVHDVEMEPVSATSEFVDSKMSAQAAEPSTPARTSSEDFDEAFSEESPLSPPHVWKYRRAPSSYL